jgi:prepilin-type N-terminal cleavage/methylation domain-containing protein
MTVTRGDRNCGFTLLEVLVGITITAIVAAIGFAFFVFQKSQYETQILATELRERVRSGMDLILRETRQAGYDPSGAGFSGVAYGSSQLQIRADLNGDGDVADANETITYAYNPGSGILTRSSGGNTETIIDHVQSFQIVYRDSDGTPVTGSENESLIRRIDISITGRTSRTDNTYPDNGGYRTLKLESKIVPRNLAL